MEIFSKKFKLKIKQIINDYGLDSIDWFISIGRIVVNMFWAYLVIGFILAFFKWIEYLSGYQMQGDYKVLVWSVGIILFLIRFPLSKIKRINLTYEEYEELKRRKNSRRNKWKKKQV